MKKTLLILIIILVLGFAAFKYKQNNTQNYPEGLEKISLQVDGLDRYYLIYTPNGISQNTKTDLIFVFHGGGSNSENVMGSSKMNEKADSEKFVVVYPQGLSDKKLVEQGTWNAGEDGGGYAVENNIDDVKFFDEILKQVKLKYDIKNVYAAGISMGGMMSYRLACERSEIIKAIAPIGSTTTLESCNPAKPVSIIHFHGTLDKFIPYNGGDSYDLPALLIVGGNYLSVQQNMDLWKDTNTCQESQATFSQQDVECKSSVCSNNTKIELCTIQNGGHTWPGSEPVNSKLLQGYVGTTTQTISATDKMWEFFNSLD